VGGLARDERETLIRAEGLSKVYGTRSKAKTAVEGVDLDIRRGDIYVLMGLSGSGKSTVLRMLNRLIEPTTGTIELGGQDLSSLNAKALRDVRNRRISMVFQHFALFPHRTVRDNAAYGLRLRGVSKAEAFAKADESLDIVGLSEWGDAKPSELSGGMKQRVGLARALSTDAEVLLMDEPFSALDPLIRRDMQDLLVKLADELGRTVVFVTHDLNEAMRLGDQITLLSRGKVAQTGTAVDILNNPADDYVKRFVGEVDRGRVLTARDVLTTAQDWAHAAPTVRVGADHTLSQVASQLSGQTAATVVDGPDVVGYLSSETVLAAVGDSQWSAA
jgi:glycine betaine/proline transport system ATP-binding protein